MRLRVLSSVLFPAPLRPMMPTVAPWGTVNDTSSSARNRRGLLRFVNAVDSHPLNASRIVLYSRFSDAPPSTYSLVRLVTAMASVTSDDVDEGPLDPLEVDQAEHQGRDRHDGRRPDEHPERRTPEYRGPESLDHSSHGIEAERHAPLLGDHRRGVGHRRRVEPDLDREREDPAE